MVDTLLFCFQGLIVGCRGVHTLGVSIDYNQIAKYLGINLTDQLQVCKLLFFFYNKCLTLSRCHCSVFIVCPWSGQLHKHVSKLIYVAAYNNIHYLLPHTQFLIIRSQWRLPNSFSFPAVICRGRHWDILQLLWRLIWFIWPLRCPCFCCCQSSLRGFQPVARGCSVSIGTAEANVIKYR